MNVAVLAAVASALLFDRVGNLAWLAGGLGTLAAVTAVAVYFYNQSLTKRDNAVENRACEQTEDRIVVVGQEPQALRGGLDALMQLSSEAVPAPVIWDRHVELLRSPLFVGKTRSYRRPSRQKNVLVEIVDKLSSPREYASFEFVLTRDGNFAIHQGRPRVTGSELEKAQGENSPWLPFPQPI